MPDYFYPRPPRGGRRGAGAVSSGTAYFYPRPPRGGRPGWDVNESIAGLISIHALREEGDKVSQSATCCSMISIHALREEGDVQRRWLLPSIPISIHALREEGDNRQGKRRQQVNHFYPRPPRGGRLAKNDIFYLLYKFLSTPSARRATAKTETKSLSSNKLYNILHEFRRALIYNGSKNYPNHAK